MPRRHRPASRGSTRPTVAAALRSTGAVVPRQQQRDEKQQHADDPTAPRLLVKIKPNIRSRGPGDALAESGFISQLDVGRAFPPPSSCTPKKLGCPSSLDVIDE